jgi:hypothetical protein
MPLAQAGFPLIQRYFPQVPGYWELLAILGVFTGEIGISIQIAPDII